MKANVDQPPLNQGAYESNRPAYQPVSNQMLPPNSFPPSHQGGIAPRPPSGQRPPLPHPHVRQHGPAMPPLPSGQFNMTRPPSIPQLNTTIPMTRSSSQQGMMSPAHSRRSSASQHRPMPSSQQTVTTVSEVLPSHDTGSNEQWITISSQTCSPGTLAKQGIELDDLNNQAERSSAMMQGALGPEYPAMGQHIVYPSSQPSYFTQHPSYMHPMNSYNRSDQHQRQDHRQRWQEYRNHTGVVRSHTPHGRFPSGRRDSEIPIYGASASSSGSSLHRGQSSHNQYYPAPPHTRDAGRTLERRGHAEYVIIEGERYKVYDYSNLPNLPIPGPNIQQCLRPPHQPTHAPVSHHRSRRRSHGAPRVYSSNQYQQPAYSSHYTQQYHMQGAQHPGAHQQPGPGVMYQMQGTQHTGAYAQSGPGMMYGGVQPPPQIPGRQRRFHCEIVS